MSLSVRRSAVRDGTYKQQRMLCIYLEGQQGIVEARKGERQEEADS